MHWKRFLIGICVLIITGTTTFALRARVPSSPQQDNPAADSVRTLVGRLDLEKYRATIKGLTQFGDRRQGTDRNRAAIDWIDAQLKADGCTNIERLKYEYQPVPAQTPATPNPPTVAAGGGPASGSSCTHWGEQ